MKFLAPLARLSWLVLAAPALFLSLALMSIVNPAIAQATADTIQIPVGTWVDFLGSWVAPLLVAVALALVRKLPKQIGDLLLTMKVEQLLQKAIDFAINTVKDATKDKPLTVNVGNEVVAKALQYVLDHAPEWLVKWMGDADLIREKIIARLNLEPEASLK